jgi:hypothetical protein
MAGLTGLSALAKITIKNIKNEMKGERGNLFQRMAVERWAFTNRFYIYESVNEHN